MWCNWNCKWNLNISRNMLIPKIENDQPTYEDQYILYENEWQDTFMKILTLYRMLFYIFEEPIWKKFGFCSFLECNTNVLLLLNLKNIQTRFSQIHSVKSNGLNTRIISMFLCVIEETMPQSSLSICNGHHFIITGECIQSSQMDWIQELFQCSCV